MARRRSRASAASLEAAGQLPLFGSAAVPLPKIERPKEPAQPDRVYKPTPAMKGAATRRINEAVEVQSAKVLARNGDDTFLLPYQPTPSINPPRPRTLAAGYSPGSRTLFVRFRDGTPWEYGDVTPQDWKNFRRVASPGRFINRVLNSHPYGRGNW